MIATTDLLMCAKTKKTIWLLSLFLANLVFGGVELQAGPFSEDFQGGVPPTGWTIENPDGLEGWESTTTTDINGNSSKVARMDNYQYNAPGALDYLTMPALDSVSYTHLRAHET